MADDHEIIRLLQKAADLFKISDNGELLKERERVLAVLEEGDGINQKTLSTFLEIKPQSLSELIDKLENDGFVYRERSESDRRQTLIYLTSQGKDRAEKYNNLKLSMEEERLSSLSDEEKNNLLGLLEKLTCGQ